MSDLARPTGPGSCPDGLSPSVSGHSPCDPSRTPWQPIATAKKDNKMVLLIARYPYGSKGWSDPWSGWWGGRSWSRWPHRFAPTHWAPITVPDEEQGIEARSAETSGSAVGESPSALGSAPDPKREGEMKKEDVA